MVAVFFLLVVSCCGNVATETLLIYLLIDCERDTLAHVFDFCLHFNVEIVIRLFLFHFNFSNLSFFYFRATYCFCFECFEQMVFSNV